MNSTTSTAFSRTEISSKEDKISKGDNKICVNSLPPIRLLNFYN